MAKKYLDYDGLLYLWGKLKAYFAPLASPALTGTPTAPTATTGTSNTQIATTAFVANTVGAMTSGVSDVKVGGTSVVTSGIANINGSETAASGGSTLSMVTTGEKYTWNNKASNSTFTAPSSSSTNGTKGLVPAPSSSYYNGRDFYVLTADASWKKLLLEQGTSNGDATKQAVILNIGSSALTRAVLAEASSSLNGLMSIADKTKLDSITMTNGVIDSSVLPSFVDDVIEAYARSNQTELGSTWLATGSASGTVITPETGKIYVLMNNSTSYSANSQFRWGGTAYVKLNDGGVSEITNGEIDTIVAS